MISGNILPPCRLGLSRRRYTRYYACVGASLARPDAPTTAIKGDYGD